MPGRPTDGPATGAQAHIALGSLIGNADRFIRLIFREHVERPLGLTQAEFQVLVFLGEREATPSTIASALLVSRARATALIQGMQTQGWIERTRSASDRRSCSLAATPAGRQLARAACDRLLAAEGQVLALTQAERAMLLELLGKL